MKLATALLAGLLFGAGLVVSGLANPAKVQNFLDIAGTWDASLALVMAAAVMVTGLGYRVARLRGSPLFEPVFQVPISSTIDASLLAGAALFGVGWGLGGFCPGPALVALTQGGASTIAFVAAMLAGMWGARFVSLERKQSAVPSS
jgi:uncharacterized membrane protein YedE/YeeE